MSVRGKNAESVLYTVMFTPERLTGTATTTYYNGYSPTTGAVMIDTADFDNLDMLVSFGTVLGEACTVTNAVYVSYTNNPMQAAAVTGASFTNINTDNDEQTMIGAVVCKDQPRYACLVTQVQTTSSIPYTVDFSAASIRGKPVSQATSNVLTFDV